MQRVRAVEGLVGKTSQTTRQKERKRLRRFDLVFPEESCNRGNACGNLVSWQDMIGLRARCRDLETRLERYRDQRDSLQRTSEVYRVSRDGDRAELRCIRWENFDLKRENDALKSIISNMRQKQYYFGNALHGGPSHLEMLYCPPSTLLPYHSKYERPLSASAGEDSMIIS
uniref:Uncharacterized protein n=1 Tax=Branchiostoma floridae TaxID=7739 RepID=C3Y924_BRAFL|eukprot:XP_002607070.1 hypothetical protein BRAFLDRAFT_68139 [Branchiostoma floridae]